MTKNELKAYYKEDTKKLIRFLVPEGSSVISLGSEIKNARKKYDYVIVDETIGNIDDIQEYFRRIKKLCNKRTRILITYYNFLWRPILNLATVIGWRKKIEEQNWLDYEDVANLLRLSGFEIITQRKRLLVPIEIPYVSDFVNHWIAPLPIISSLCLKTWTLARLRQDKRKEYSVSIVIPARNEESNIKNLLDKIPKFGKWQEVIFVEGHSKDKTWEAIQKEIARKNTGKTRLVALKQKDIGKADAVRLGFEKAKGEILMILDADLTVDPQDLPKFYEALADGLGEFANGSRLMYPMEKEAMNTLNILGNKIFSLLFTWILGQRFKDTLCGTKVLFRKNYKKISENRKFFGNFDPFGDYDLIFGAVKLGLKITEIPIRYKERVYGTTNIRRFKHGWLLLKMSVFAFKKFNLS